MIYKEFLEAGYIVFGLHRINEDGTCGCGNERCEAVGKHPISQKWQSTPRYNKQQIEYMEETGKFSTGYGVLAEGLLVIDVDARNGGVESYAKLLEAIPDIAGCELIVSTGSGNGSKHLYYRYSGSESLSMHLDDYPGIDFKSGGYVVGPGSLHKSGNKYDVLMGDPYSINDAPSELINKLKRTDSSRVEHNGVQIDITLTEVANIVGHIPPEYADDYSDWLRIGMAIHHCTSGNGMLVWDEFSRKCPAKYDASAIVDKWHSFGKLIGSAMVTVGTLIYYAKKGGYITNLEPRHDDCVVGDDGDDGEAVDDMPPIGDVLSNLQCGLGLLQEYIHGQMIYPSLPMAGVAALVYLSHFAQTRALVRSPMGDLTLNEYYLVCAKSGFGKERLRVGLERLHEEVIANSKNPMRSIGASRLQYQLPASKQGLHSLLDQSGEGHRAQTFLSDEFAEWLIQASGGSSESHKQATLGYLMEIYTKGIGVVNVSIAVTKSYKPVKNPRVSIFATTTGERLVESLTASQADSGAYNRFIPFIADDPGEKRYEGFKFTPRAELIGFLSGIVSMPEDTVVPLSSDAWEYFKRIDSDEMEKIKRDDTHLGARLSEQALKMSGLIAISCGHTEVLRSDLDAAFAIRKSLYHRAKAYFAMHGALGVEDETGRACKQVMSLLSSLESVSLSRVENSCRIYRSLSLRNRQSVIEYICSQGYATLVRSSRGKILQLLK